ncbi:MAG TPA: glycerol-3-phosphate 1-O-acyltransferase PlsY [Planctomycetota bacterium]|nr:glycerol-3-phosphate 1-O-acyltransferase PlsY [Planctomycetota bacterium]
MQFHPMWGAAALASYLVGAIPFGWITAKLVRGIDLRTHGSGNVGATNAARVLGTAWFIPIFALDFLKGFAPAFWLAPWVAKTWPCPVCPALEPVMMAMCGVAALAGHLFPVYLQFKGGKGVATGAGVVFALSWLAGVAGAALWVVLFLTTRYVSVASMGAAIALPVAQAVLVPGTSVRLALFVGIAATVVWRHVGNVQRLLRGEEPRVRIGTPKP